MRHASTGILSLCLLAGNLAQAQSPKPTMYTYVSTWAVPRAMWADYRKLDSADETVLSKAVADGTIAGYGRYSVLNHQDGQPTHGTWFSATSMGNLMKALDLLRATPASEGPVLAASKHWDYIMQTRDYNGHSGNYKNAYLRVAQWNYKATANDPGGKVMKAAMVPVFEKLLNDGSIYAYEIDTESIHSSDPDSLTMVLIANGPEGIDKFNAAIDDLENSNPLALSGVDSLLDSHGHRDILAKVDAMMIK